MSNTYDGEDGLTHRSNVEDAVFSVIPQNRRFSLTDKRETFECCNFSDRSKAYKNVLGICTSFAICFGSFLGILGLQSSINSVQGLGLASNAIVYATTMVAALFASVYVKLIGTKFSLISGYSIFLVCIACNYYPSWYTIIPGSVLFGLFQNVVWVAVFAHATAIATKYATALKEKPEDAIALFTGSVATSVKVAFILGNIVSSSVLFNFSTSNTNFTMEISGSGEFSENDVCNNVEASQLEQNYLYYILISLYMLFGIIGIIITVILVDHLGTNYIGTSSKASRMCKEILLLPIVDVLKTSLSTNMLLLIPPIILNGLSLGYLIGTFSKVFISDCVGVQWIGIAIAAFGISGGVAALAAARLVRYIPQYIVMYTSLLIGSCLSLVFIFLEREPSFLAVFGFSIFWGISEGIINSIIPGLLGVLFHEHQESAFALLQMFISVGFTFSFSTSLVLDSVQQLWMIFGLIIIVTITYTILTLKIGSKEQLLPCCFKKEEGTNGIQISKIRRESEVVTEELEMKSIA